MEEKELAAACLRTKRDYFHIILSYTQTDGKRKNILWKMNFYKLKNILKKF